MNKYEKCATSLMQLGDKIIAEKKHRKAIIMRSTALSLGAAAIIGVGICANALKPPKKPTAESSGIISNTTEAVTTSAEIIVQTSAKTAATQKHSTVTASVSTEAVTAQAISSYTENSTVKPTSTAAVTSALKTSTIALASSRSTAKPTEIKPQTVASSLTTFIGSQTHFSRSTTTATASSVTKTEDTAIAHPVTTITSDAKTTTRNNNITTTAHHGSTAGATTTLNHSTTTAVVTAPVIYRYDWIVGESFPTISYSSKNMLVSSHSYVYEDEIDSLAAVLTLKPQTNTEILPAAIPAKVYTMKRYPNGEYVAVKFEGSVVYWVYSMNDRPKT